MILHAEPKLTMSEIKVEKSEVGKYCILLAQMWFLNCDPLWYNPAFNFHLRSHKLFFKNSFCENVTKYAMNAHCNSQVKQCWLIIFK